MKKGILLKISGEWLGNSENIICNKKLDNLLKQIKILIKTYNVAIVLGGGNVFRGKISKNFNLKQAQGDSIGMMATVINGLFLKYYFNNNGLVSNLFSPINIEKISKPDDLTDINNSFKQGEVAIFVAGTGLPFFTTDTCAAVRAAQLDISTILFGKNGVDGLYNKDPNVFKDAKFIDKITYKEMICQNLNAIDLTASNICLQNKIDAIIFNIDADNCFINALNNVNKKSIISWE
ncbi:MAG: UMP kinase [Mycoplasmoidaceae bacterium]